MTKEQTKTCLETAVRACYFGATRRSRLAWNLAQKGIPLVLANDFIWGAIEAKLMEDNSYGWISATPFMSSIAAQFDELTSDIEFATVETP